MLILDLNIAYRWTKLIHFGVTWSHGLVHLNFISFLVVWLDLFIFRIDWLIRWYRAHCCLIGAFILALIFLDCLLAEGDFEGVCHILRLSTLLAIWSPMTLSGVLLVWSRRSLLICRLRPLWTLHLLHVSISATFLQGILLIICMCELVLVYLHLPIYVSWMLYVLLRWPWLTSDVDHYLILWCTWMILTVFTHIFLRLL